MLGHPTWNALALVTLIVGFCMTTRTAAWSLGMDRSPRFSKT